MPIGVSIRLMSETYVKVLQTIAEDVTGKDRGFLFSFSFNSSANIHAKTDFTTEGLNLLSLKPVELS